MIHGYVEEYLNDAMKNLGEAFDCAVNVYGIGIDDFMELFIATGYAQLFEKGNPKIISGLSGTELVMECFNKAQRTVIFQESQVEYSCSPEYWCGWILAYYQWKTCQSFKFIHSNVLMIEIIKLYNTLHEASEEKFVDKLNEIIRRKNKVSRLQQQRKKCGYSQRELSEKSGVNLRTLQQYELRTKDINKASVQSIISLSSALKCRIEDLLEYSLE